MTEIRIKGREILFSTNRMIRNIARTETAVTILKSRSVVSIISFVQGPSPMTSPLLSYFFTIPLITSIWLLISSVATPYSEPISINSQFSLLSADVSLSGIRSSGILDPMSDSRLSTYLTPLTFFICSVMERTLSASRSDLTRIMCVAPTPYSSLSFVVDMM